MHVIRFDRIFNQAGGCLWYLGKDTGRGWISGMRSWGSGMII